MSGWQIVGAVVAGVLIVAGIAGYAAAARRGLFRRAVRGDELAVRPGVDDQFATWPALRVPEKRLVVLCAACRAAPVCLPDPRGSALAARFCAGCIDSCWNELEPGHSCVVCMPSTAPPAEQPPSTSTSEDTR